MFSSCASMQAQEPEKRARFQDLEISLIPLCGQSLVTRHDLMRSLRTQNSVANLQAKKKSLKKYSRKNLGSGTRLPGAVQKNKIL
jgi:hypothetical protein